MDDVGFCLGDVGMLSECYHNNVGMLLECCRNVAGVLPEYFWDATRMLWNATMIMLECSRNITRMLSKWCRKYGGMLAGYRRNIVCMVHICCWYTVIMRNKAI